MTNTVVTDIVVTPKSKEPGAFQVAITGGGFAKTPYKWFYGERIFPASRKYFGRNLYGQICGLIRKSAKSGEKIRWHKASQRRMNGDAFVHEMMNKSGL